MKILLTGVSGFIGSYLAGQWKNGRHKIIGTDMKDRPGSKIPFFICDLSSEIKIKEPVDAIVHVAAQSPGVGIKTQDFLGSNVNSVSNLIAYARKFKVKKFIYLSSISLYGKITRSRIDEDTPMVSASTYGLTKYIAELLLRDEEDWLAAVALRLPGVVGKGATTCWLAQAARKLKQNEMVTIYNPDAPFNNMVYLKDLERFISRLILKDFRGFHALTLGCTKPLSVLETVEYLKKCLHAKSKIKIIGAKEAAFGISLKKAIKMGYRPSIARQILSAYSREIK